ncbi:MAG: ATP-binding protein [Thermodesulfobacteriota bacterium]
MRFRKTIASRLMLTVLGSSLLLVVAGAGLQFGLDYSREMRLLNARVDDVQRSHVPAMENSLWLADWEMLRVQAEGIQRLPEIRFVAIVAGGRRLVAVGREAGEGVVPQVFQLQHRYKGEMVSLGSLIVHADVQSVRQRVLEHFFLLLAAQVVITCSLVALVLFVFHRLVGRHLKAMAGYLRRFEPSRLETPLLLDKKKASRNEERDEIDQVVHSFNAMRQDLKRTFDSLHQVNVELLRENRERVKAETSLRESEQRYAMLVNTIQEVFWMVSADYRQVLFISPAYEAVWGRSCESLLADPRSWLTAVVEEDRPAVAAVIDVLARGNDLPPQAEFPEYRIRRPDGTLRWIKAKAVPLRDESGRVWSFAGLCEDISSRKESEEKLRQAQKMEAIGTLAGGIAHDFNNILAAILGYADLIRYETGETDPHRKHIEEIIRAGKRAKALVQQILAFSRKGEQQRRPVTVAPIVKEALKLLRASIPATIEIVSQIRDPDGTVLADPVQLHQVVVNLCTNASHAMEEQGGTLTVSLAVVEVGPEEAAAMGGQPGRFVRLAVADTGCGMDEATRQRIFDPYFTTKAFGKGSGMGLAVVHGIVQGSGGMVRVISEVGTGTTFDIFFPAVDQPAEPEPALATVCPPGSERILLVDDEPAVAETAQQWLSRLGYSVTAVNSSLEALRLFRDNPRGFDLLVTDQAMPHLPGSELARQVLAIRPDLPILLCTGYSSVVNEEKAREIGIRRYAYKPLQGSELARLVRQLLDEQAAAR